MICCHLGFTGTYIHSHMLNCYVCVCIFFLDKEEIMVWSDESLHLEPPVLSLFNDTHMHIKPWDNIRQTSKPIMICISDLLQHMAPSSGRTTRSKETIKKSVKTATESVLSCRLRSSTRPPWENGKTYEKTESCFLKLTWILNFLYTIWMSVVAVKVNPKYYPRRVKARSVRISSLLTGSRKERTNERTKGRKKKTCTIGHKTSSWFSSEDAYSIRLNPRRDKNKIHNR